MHKNNQGKIDYFPQLDGLRCFAIILVMLHHWVIAGSRFDKFPFGLTLGMMGVNLFFVLSGFLITNILIKGRNNNEKNNLKNSWTLRQFYVRRFLRIFPAYYLMLFIVWISNFSGVRDNIIWLLTYTANIRFTITQQFHGSISHLWSLAVEEQFYLLWPFLILFLPKRLLKNVLFIVIVLAVLERYIFSFLSFPAITIDIFTVSCFDSLGLGAFLAYLFNFNLNFLARLLNKRYFFFLVFILFAFLLLYTSFIRKIKAIDAVFLRALYSILCFYIVGKALKGYKGLLRVVLEHPWIIFIGTISYGLYLYHLFAPEIVMRLLKYPWINSLAGSALVSAVPRFIILFVVTFSIAICSWFLVEKPILGLKKRVLYN